MVTKSINRGRLLLLLSFYFICTSGFTQSEKTIFIGTNGRLTSIKNAIYMQNIDIKSRHETKVITYQHKEQKWAKICAESFKRINDSTYQVNGKGENIPARYTRIFKRLDDKNWKFKDIADGQVLRNGSAQSIIPLLLNGEVVEYYPGGNKKSISFYNNNELISNENWREDGVKYFDNIFFSVDTYPTYSDGITKLHEHIMKAFMESQIQLSDISGSVIVGFVVLENGNIDGIKVLKGVGTNINNIAYEAFKSLPGRWTPAMLNNQTVRYFQVFPINFISRDNHLQFAELRGAFLHFQTY